METGEKNLATLFSSGIVEDWHETVEHLEVTYTRKLPPLASYFTLYTLQNAAESECIQLAPTEFLLDNADCKEWKNYCEKC